MPTRPIDCVYDWVEGSEGAKLECVTHRGACHTVFVMLLPDHSTLLDMLHLGILQGKALTDAETLASSESWLAN